MTDHLEAHRLASLALDDEIDAIDAAELDQHLASCADCARHVEHLHAVRSQLRSFAEPEIDVRAGVLAALTTTAPVDRTDARASSSAAIDSEVRRLADEPASRGGRGAGTAGRRRSAAARWLPVAACLLVGLLLGSVLVGGWREPPPPAAAQVPERVAAAQFGVTSLSAGIEITEWGWNDEVPTRHFVGSIDYQAPESLALHLDDTTAYPSGAWVPDDVDVVRHDRQWWARGPRDCPSLGQPGCTAPEPRLEVIDAVEPFDDGAAVPLDLVVPVRSFLRSPEPTSLGTRSIDGRDAVGVEVTAAQVAPLLDGLRPAGNLRQFFPSDVVALWLDATSWTPLRIEVTASGEPDRRTWAINRGYVDRPGGPILTVDLHGLRINAGIDPQRLAAAPDGGVRRDAGFTGSATGSVPSGAVVVDPVQVPEGLTRSTTGVVGAGTDHETVVQTWAGGRGWIKVSSTATWNGTRLFGDLGSPIRRLDGPDGSVRYGSLDGTRIAVHGADVDVVITGSVDEEALLRVADGLQPRGLVVPGEWSDAATETIASARELLPGLLVPPTQRGDDAPAVRADGNVVTQGYAGAGGRGFVMVTAPGERLSPPLDMDTAGVVVRGVDGRYSAARGELEWVEDDLVHRITSTTLSRAELLALAASLVAA